MTTRRFSLIGSVLVSILLVAALFHFSSDRSRRLGPRPPGRGPTPAAPPAPSSPLAAPPAAPTPADDTTERSALADSLNAKDRDIRSDLQVVATILDAFRSNFPERGNPTGTNAEITAVLTGKNPLHLALIPRDHPAINARGELCDRWGHPFFFHQLSGTQMEIRSAGPDQKFWTDDDVVLSP